MNDTTYLVYNIVTSKNRIPHIPREHRTKSLTIECAFQPYYISTLTIHRFEADLAKQYTQRQLKVAQTHIVLLVYFLQIQQAH